MALRSIDQRLVTWGFWALVSCAILYFILISAVPSLSHGPQAIIPALPMLACVLVLGIGLVRWAVGLVGRRSATRFFPGRQ